MVLIKTDMKVFSYISLRKLIDKQNKNTEIIPVNNSNYEVTTFTTSLLMTLLSIVTKFT